jgi:predicted Fe-Mo cluster-binding NifX family protein
MKYAIPVIGSRISAHFGQSTEFMILDADEKSGKVTKNETMSTTPHNCGNLPGLLADKGVSVVLAGGMGLGPRTAFQQRNIQVVLGVTEADPEKAVKSHLNRTLISGRNICEHGDTLCDHSEHHN